MGQMEQSDKLGAPCCYVFDSALCVMFVGDLGQKMLEKRISTFGRAPRVIYMCLSMSLLGWVN